MKLPAKCRIEELVAKADRERICHTHLDMSDPDRPRLRATNGHALVSIAVEVDDGDSSGPVPVQAIRLSRKRDVQRHAIRSGVGGIRCGKDAVEFDAAGGVLRVPRPDGAFPAVDGVLSGFAGKKTVRIGLNPYLLVKIARAVDANAKQPCVVLEFELGTNGDAGGVVGVSVIGGTGPDHEAALMPMYLEPRPA